MHTSSSGLTYHCRYNSTGGNLHAGAAWPASEMRPGWNHYVVNFNRNGNMTTYRNATLTSTNAMPDAGAPTNQGNLRFYPLTTYLLGDVYINMLVGPVALHVGGAGALLTGAQMRDSGPGPAR